MKRSTFAVAFLFCLLTGSTRPSRTTTTLRPNANSADTRLLNLVPADCFAAVELRDLDRRWAEIRDSKAIAQFQDFLLHQVGIEPDRVPSLAAASAVFILARSDSAPFIVPVALLRPHRRAAALGAIAGSGKLIYREGHDTLWIGPESAGGLLDTLVRGAYPSLGEVLPIGEIDARLQGNGLLRGYVNPQAWAEATSLYSDQTNFEPPRWIAEWLRAEFSALRYVAFQRDIVAGEIETNVVAAYDKARLPKEVAGIFVPDRPPIPAAPSTPPGTIATFSFRLEAMAWLPWLRHLAARDRHGPLRNLDFWLEEFEGRYHRNLSRDLCAALGEHGWLFLVEGEHPGSAAAVALAEVVSNHAESIESTLADLLDWVGEGAWIDTLGALIPRSWTGAAEGTVTRGLDLWTPLGHLTGLRFAVAGRYLIIATEDSALRSGLALARDLTNTGILPRTLATHAAVRLQGDAIARFLSNPIAMAARRHNPFLEAFSRLLGGIDSISLDVNYEHDGMRLEGHARFAK